MPVIKEAQTYSHLVTAKELEEALEEFELEKHTHLQEYAVYLNDVGTKEQNPCYDDERGRSSSTIPTDALSVPGCDYEEYLKDEQELKDTRAPPTKNGRRASLSSGAIGKGLEGLGRRFSGLSISSDKSKKKTSSLRAERPPSIDDAFPNLQGSTQISDDFDLYEYLGNSWGIVFCHPDDFTPVCTTELGQAARMAEEFENRGVKLCGYSCNDANTHWQWIKDIYIATGAYVRYPIFADPTREMAYQLGILDKRERDNKDMPVAMRGVYVVRPDKSIALTMMYPVSTGRNFDEILRIVDALQLTVSSCVATPANWKQGDDVIVGCHLSDKEANARFGKDNWRTVDLPSEKGRKLKKHYLRYTPAPSPSYN